MFPFPDFLNVSPFPLYYTGRDIKILSINFFFIFPSCISALTHVVTYMAFEFCLQMIRAPPRLNEHELACLEKGSLINASVIESYLKHLEWENSTLKLPPKIFSLDPTFLLEVERKNLDKAFRHFKRGNPLMADKILVPFHVTLPGNIGHWALLVVLPPEKRIEVYDSLWISHKRQLYLCYEAFKMYSKVTNMPIDGSSWHLVDSVKSIPRQTNATDCGVFLCWYCDRLARNQPITDISHVSFDPDAFREYLKFVLADEPEKGPHTKFIPQKCQGEDNSETIPTTQTNLVRENSWDSLTDDIIHLENSMDETVDESTFEVVTADMDISMEPVEVKEASPVLSIHVEDDDLSLLLGEETDSPTAEASTSDGQHEASTAAELPGQMDCLPWEAETLKERENPQIPPPKRKREKKHKIYLPGIGWTKIKHRFLRPDLFGPF